jgi:hypothetical protein
MCRCDRKLLNPDLEADAFMFNYGIQDEQPGLFCDVRPELEYTIIHITSFATLYHMNLLIPSFILDSQSCHSSIPLLLICRYTPLLHHHVYIIQA